MTAFPDTLVNLLGELISRPSVGETGAAQREQALAEYVAGLLRTMGGEVEMTPVQPGRPNLLARFATKTHHSPVVALVPHLDTVGVEGMTVSPFVPTRRHGRIYGRGACDTKGPMAAALWALRQYLVHREKSKAGITWVFAATMGEEEGGTGARALCAQGFRADFVIALEPTDLRVVRAAKGVLRVWVKSAGRACHASAPEEGDNAIYKLLPFLRTCERRLAPMLHRARHPELGAASLAVSIISGGRELNVIPDSCRIGLDIRTHQNLPNKVALRLIRSAAADLEVRVHCDGPPFALDETEPWLQALQVHTAGPTTAPWFSDANIFNAHGMPCVAFGPGSITQAHTADEYIEVASLEAGARALEAFISAVAVCPPAVR